MNHRQWKKNFKKQHGRNPYWFEDKRERQRRGSSAIITGCYKGIGALYDGIQNAMPYLREGLNQFATAATKAANEVAKSFTQVFDCFQLPEQDEMPSRNEFLQARMYCCEPLMENAIVQITEPKNTQEEKDGV
jgi:hypothetical protein